MHRLFASTRVLGTSLSLLSGLCSPAWSAQPSTSFTIDGAVATAATCDLACVRALPVTTQTVALGSRTPTFVGTNLYALVASAGVATRATVHNDVLSKLVLATGTDGYRVVRAIGELHPDFGHRDVLVAYAEVKDGTAAPLAGDGFVRLTAPGDVKGGRALTNLASLRVLASASTKHGTGGGIVASFSVSGEVKAERTFDLATLRSLPSRKVTIGETTYTGIGLWELLDSIVGLASDATAKNALLAKYVVATGSDGYRVVFSMGELDPAFGNQPDFIAYEVDGAPLATNGFARLIVPNDLRPGRRVSSLASLEVFTAVAP